jgi:catechol 2,3-dioxygenase-like lactoylglutathione lyase family enzyme
MPIANAIASLAVRDLQAAVQWYRAVLGKAPDSQPMPEVAEWQFERGGWLQVYSAPDRAGRGSVTLAVTSIDGEAERLAGLGLEIDTSRRTTSVKVKTLMIADPDGNSIAFAEALDPTIAQ